MLVIRYLRVGKKNQPSFQVVVADKRKSAKAGRFVEKVGFYNPLTKAKGLNAERIKYWLSVGAQPSATLWNLLIAEKIAEGKKKPVHKKSKKQAETKATAAFDAMTEAPSAPKAETASNATEAKPVPVKAEEKPAASNAAAAEAAEEKSAESEEK